MFNVKQIVWAKVRGFPWWPAQVVNSLYKIAKLSVNQSPFKVTFIGQNNHAFLNLKQIKKYQQNYSQFSQKQCKGLQPSIQKADQIYKKRKLNNQIQSEVVKQQQSQLKTKKILKRGRHKLRGRKPKPKQQLFQHQIQQQNIQLANSQKLEAQRQKSQQQVIVTPVVKRKYLKKKQRQKQREQILEQKEQKQQEESHLQKDKQKQQSANDSQMQGNGWSQIQGQLQNNPIDRSRINCIQEGLFDIITKLNNYEYTGQLKYYKSIRWQQLTADQISQSKITNMLTYIIKKAFQLSLNGKAIFNPEEKEFVSHLAQNLKEKIIQYLFDTHYYDQYLKLVQKNQHHQNQYQQAIKRYLRTNYKIKKQFSEIFAQYISKQISNGNLTKEKKLLFDLKQKNVQIIPFNNKAALERSAETLIRTYA